MVHGLLFTMASLAAESIDSKCTSFSVVPTGSVVIHGFGSCGSEAHLVALWRVESSRTRDGTHVLYTGRGDSYPLDCQGGPD